MTNWFTPSPGNTFGCAVVVRGMKAGKAKDLYHERDPELEQRGTPLAVPFGARLVCLKDAPKVAEAGFKEKMCQNH